MELNSVLLLARQESLVTVDKRMLRHNGSRPFRRLSVMDSGLKAAQGLALTAQNRLSLPDLLVCDLPLADMTAVQFLSLIRLHPALRALPVLLLGRPEDIQGRAELEKLTPVVCLARPYTETEFVNALDTLAAQTAEAAAAADPESETAFRAALKLMVQPRQENGPEELLRQGIGLLRRKRPAEAAQVFQKVINRHPSFTAQGLQGLAEAEAGQGNLARSRQLLYKAAIINVRAHNFQAAQRAFARLDNMRCPEEAAESHKVNPLYQAGAALVKSGHFEAAASAFWHGMNLTPNDPMPGHIARACQFTSNPERAARGLCQAMESKSPSLARDLRKILLGEGMMDRGERDEPWRDYGAVGNFLANVYSVARYTVQMYKQA